MISNVVHATIQRYAQYLLDFTCLIHNIHNDACNTLCKRYSLIVASFLGVVAYLAKIMDCQTGDISLISRICLFLIIYTSRYLFITSFYNWISHRLNVCVSTSLQYSIENSGFWLPRGLAPQRWGRLILTMLIMFGCPIGAYVVCHVISKAYAQALAIGAAAIIELVCLK